MTTLTVNDLLLILGTKEVELYQLRARIQELEQAGQEGLALLRAKVETLESERIPATKENRGEPD